MAKKKNRREEYLHHESPQKKTYFFRDDNLGIDVKSKEVYKKSKKVSHFPFDRRGLPKYGEIKEIAYEGLPDPLPRGILKDPGRGYGFTKIFGPLIYALEKKFSLNKSVVRLKGKIEVKGRVLYLNYADLNNFYPRMDSLLTSHGQQKDVLVAKFLKGYFPTQFQDKKQPFIKGSIYALLANTGIDADKVSKEDYDAMLDIVMSRVGNLVTGSKKVILETKEKIEKKILEDAVTGFKKILSIKNKTKNLEKRWEMFFKDNFWIISNLFSLPVALFANQAYVGGKEIFNIHGKVTDFLFKNSLTDNLSVIEHKTHKAPLLAKRPYRGDDVYALSEELSGAINQVLDQRQNLLNEFHSLRSKGGKDAWFEAYSSKCLIIAGTLKDLPSKGQRSFELMRNSIHGVEIITFDEVLKKIEVFVSMLKQPVKKVSKKKLAKSPRRAVKKKK
jgi:hypothetical protein